MKYEDIKGMSNKELHANLREERQQLQKLKFSHAVSPVENPQKIRISRRTIAKYLTEMNKRTQATIKA